MVWGGKLEWSGGQTRSGEGNGGEGWRMRGQMNGDCSGSEEVVAARTVQSAADDLVSWERNRPVPVGRDQPVRAGRKNDRL